MIFFFTSLLSFNNADQSLTLARLTYRHHQTPTQLELRNQWLRNCWTTGSNQNPVVRRVCSPAQRTVKTLHGRVVNSQLPDPCLCFAGEIADALDRVNLCSDF